MMPIIFLLPLFLISCCIGYLVVWRVRSATPMPLIAMTSALGSVIIVGALVATAETSGAVAKYLGLAGIVLASANLFGGFTLAGRLLASDPEKTRE